MENKKRLINENELDEISGGNGSVIQADNTKQLKKLVENNITTSENINNCIKNYGKVEILSNGMCK